MAIDSRFLDEITPSEEAVNRLSRKKRRLRPWESALIPTTTMEPDPVGALPDPTPSVQNMPAIQPAPQSQAVESLNSSKTLPQTPAAIPTRTGSEVVAKPVAPVIATGSEVIAEPVARHTRSGSDALPIQPELVAEPVARHTRTSSEVVAEPVALMGLVQLQRKVLFYVFSRCQMAASLTSPLITKEEMRIACKTTSGAAKQAILKLEQKGFLKRLHSINGVSGGIIFQLPNSVFQTLLFIRTGSEVVANAPELVAEPVAELVAASSRGGGGSINIRSSTSSEPGKIEPDPAWAQIDFSSLAYIGFTQTHVQQIINAKSVTPEQLQHSVDAFAFDLEENKKIDSLKVPLNYFMSSIRKGPYAPPSNYESPEEKKLRLYLEAAELQKSRREALEQRVETVQFEEWIEALPDNEKMQLVPPQDFAKPGSAAHAAQLREFFRNNIWPKLRSNLLKERVGR